MLSRHLLMMRNALVCQDRLRTNTRGRLTADGVSLSVFVRARRLLPAGRAVHDGLHRLVRNAQVRRRLFLRHFILKRVVLPRQARDKRRGSTHKKGAVVLCPRSVLVAGCLHCYTQRMDRRNRGVTAAAAGTGRASGGLSDHHERLIDKYSSLTVTTTPVRTRYYCELHNN